MAKDTIKELEGQTVRDRDGATIGKVKEVYLDEDTDRPTWAGGLITLIVVVLDTLLAAILGGKAGERYHRKVDRAGANR